MDADADDPWFGKVALVGMACRFPGAPSAAAYWANLLAGADTIERFAPADAAVNRLRPRARAEAQFVGAEGTVPDVDLFDHALFGYGAGEAARLDPQLRLALQCSHEALHDANCAGAAGERLRTGVFFGASLSTFALQYLLPRQEGAGPVDGLGLLLGGDKDHVATTIAYRLGLTGPAMAVGSGCSSSAVAIHQACLALLTYQCDAAVAGGASVLFPQRQGHVYQDGGIYSRDGSCRPFSADACGTVGGSGVGAVVLKRLEDALRDGDRIYCVVAGSGCANDGQRKLGYAAPSVSGQADAIRAALDAARAAPPDFVYVEAHGTATTLGDPVELRALGEAFGAGLPAASCALGSVKANIGHLDAASGVAGAIKAALCIHHGRRVPQPHFRPGHPLIDWATSPFFVATEAGALFHRAGGRCVGVNSLGMGGTNAFLVLEAPPEAVPAAAQARPELVVVSAHAPQALRDGLRALLDFAEPGRPDLTRLAYTLAMCRPRLQHRAAFACRDLDDLAAQLRAAVAADAAAPASDLPALDALREAWLRDDAFDWAGRFPPDVRPLPLPSYAYLRTPCRLPGLDGASTGPQPLSPAIAQGEPLPAASPAGRAARERIEALCVALAGGFLGRRGVPLAAGGRVARAEALARLGLLPAYAGFGRYLLALLERHGVLREHDGALELLRPPGDAQALAQALLRDHPDQEPLVRLLLAVAGGWEQVVCAGQPPVGAVGGWSLAAIGAALACDARQTGLAGAYFRRVARLVAERHAALGRPLRVLEIGCGHLALTESLLRAPELAQVADYWITDADRWLVDAAQGAYAYLGGAAQGCRLHFAAFDIDRPAAGQPVPRDLDLVIGFNVLHVAKDLRRAMRHLAGLLADGGQVCQVDLVDPAASVQLLWGIFPEWWGAADARANGPLLSAAGHRRLLAETAARHTLVADAPVDEDAVSVLWTCEPAQAGTGAAAQDMTYLPAWERAPRAAPAGWGEGEVTLLLHDDARLAQALRALAAGPVVEAVPAGLAQAGGGVETLAPGDPEAVRALPGTVLARHGRLDRVVLAWRAPPLEGDGEACLRHALGMPQALAAALDQAVDRPVEWLLVSRGLYRVGGGEVLAPEESLALDLSRMAALEYPRLQLRHLELEQGALPPPQVLRAAYGASAQAESVAVRGSRLWTPGWRPAPLEREANALDLDGSTLVLVGGLGGLGLEIADELARRYRLHLAIVHRAAWLDAADAGESGGEDEARRRTRRRLDALAARCLSLTLERADVNDAAAIAAAAARIGARHPQVAGVLHLAGAIDPHGMLRNRPFETLRDAVRTKTVGLKQAVAAFAPLRPGFQLAFSSLGAVLHKAKFGEAGYVVANGFMNAYARALGGLPPGLVSVSWTDWQAAGMWVDAQARLRARYALESPAAGDASRPAGVFDSEHWLESIPAARGVDLLLAIAGAGEPEVVVCAQDLQALLELQRHATQQDYGRYLDSLRLRAAAAPDAGMDAGDGLRFDPGSLRGRLAALWQEVLGVPVRQDGDNFYAAGGDSLLMLRLASLVKDRFAVELGLSELTEAGDFAALARLVEEGMGADAH